MKLLYSSSSTNSCYESQLINTGDRIRFANRRVILPDTTYIQKLLTVKRDSIKFLWCFRRSGSLELYHIDEGDYVQLYGLSNCKNDEKDFAVSLQCVGDIVYCCTNKGKLTIIDMSHVSMHVRRSGKTKLQLPVHTMQLSEPISSFAINPADQWMVACGGYNNHLQIYNLMSPFHDTEVDEILASNELLRILNYSSITKILPSWIAKSKKRGHRDLCDEFPWITDIVFMEEQDYDDDHNPINEGVKLCCATQFGKLSYYNTAVSQFAINELTISNHRVRKLVKLQTQDLLFIDSFGSIGVIRNESVLYHYRVSNFGSLSGLDILEIGVASSSSSSFDNSNCPNMEKDDDDDEDLIKLSARRQSHLSQYKLKSMKLNDIFILYTTIIGEMRLIKLKNGDNETELVSSTKLPKMPLNGYCIPCLSYDFDDDVNELNDLMRLKEEDGLVQDDELMMMMKRQKSAMKLRKKYRINTYI